MNNRHISENPNRLVSHYSGYSSSRSKEFKILNVQTDDTNLWNKGPPLPAQPSGLEGQLVGLSLTPPPLNQPKIVLTALCCCSSPRYQKSQSLQ